MAKRKVMKRKIVTMDEYNKIMDKIIKKDKPVDETLIDLLEEAAKYDIKPTATVSVVKSKNRG